MAFNSMSDEYKAKRNEFISFCKDEQMKMYLVEMMIYNKIIKDCNMKVADQILFQIEENIHISPRSSDRIKIMIREITIATALEALFNVPGAKHHGVPFDEFQLLDIEPMLVATEEITLHVIDLLFDEVVDPGRRKVLEALWDLIENISYIEYMTTSSMAADVNYIKFNKFFISIGI